MPYPTAGTTTGGVKKVEGKKPKASTHKSKLNSLHKKLMTMPAGKATVWHKALDDYVLTAAELYKALASE